MNAASFGKVAQTMTKRNTDKHSQSLNYNVYDVIYRSYIIFTDNTANVSQSDDTPVR